LVSRCLFHLLVTGVLAVLLSACRADHQADLLSVEAIRPGEIGPGSTIRLVGSGFPSGRQCEIAFTGEASGPGGRPSKVAISLPGHARSANRVEAVVSDRDMERLGNGAFDGSVRLAFRSAAGASLVTGQLSDVHLQLSQSAADGRPAASVWHDRVLARGFLGAAADPSRRAPRAAPAAPGSTLLRYGTPLVLFLLCIVFLSPFSHCLSRFPPGPGPAARSRSVPSVGLWAVWGASRASAPDEIAGDRFLSGLATYLPAMAVTAFFVAVPFSESLLDMAINPLLVCLVWAGLRIGATLCTPGFAGLHHRLRRTVEPIPHLLVACIPVLYACASSASFSVGEIGSTQGALPWQWSVFTNLALFAAFPFYVASCSARFRLASDSDGSSRPFVRLVEASGGAMMCAVGAVVFFGGWRTVDAPLVDPIVTVLLGVMAFAAKAWFMGYLIDAFREVRIGREIPYRHAAVTLLGSSVIAGVWAVAAISPGVETAVGTATLATVLVLLGARAYRSIGRGRSVDLSPVHPHLFL
jgi:hypothetical protein